MAAMKQRLQLFVLLCTISAEPQEMHTRPQTTPLLEVHADSQHTSPVPGQPGVYHDIAMLFGSFVSRSLGAKICSHL